MITCGGCTAIYPDELDTCPHCNAPTPLDTGVESGSDALFDTRITGTVTASATHPTVDGEGPRDGNGTSSDSRE